MYEFLLHSNVSKTGVHKQLPSQKIEHSEGEFKNTAYSFMLNVSDVQVLDLVLMYFSLRHWHSHSILVNSSKIVAVFFLVNFLTAQFHESASGLRSCWLDHPNRSVFHTPFAKGLGNGPPSTAQCAGCWRCHFISGLRWQEALIYGTQEPFFFQAQHLVCHRCMDRWTCTALAVKRTDKKSLVPACWPEWN